MMAGVGQVIGLAGLAARAAGYGKAHETASVDNPNEGYYAYQGNSSPYYDARAGAAQGRAYGPSADSMQSRGQMQNAMGLYQAAANGTGPSAAQAQYQQNANQAMQSQMAMAASARGGGLAQVAAARQAAMGAGQQQIQAAQGAAMLRAQEQQAGMQGYAGMAGQMQGADLQQQQQALAQRQMNDQYSMGLMGLGQRAGENQTAARQAYEQARHAEWVRADNVRLGNGMYNAKQDSDTANAMVSYGSGMAGYGGK